MQDNVSPLGGKSSMGSSAVVAAELKAFGAYKVDLDGVRPVNSNAAAKALRGVMVKHAKDEKARGVLRAVFASLGLDF